MKSVLVLGALAALSLPLGARASLITGVLNTTGTASISLGNIAFLDNLLTINSPAAAQQGGFMALAGTSGTIMNINNATVTPGVPVAIMDFVTFAAAPNISFELTLLLPGIDGAAGCAATPPAAGQVCTPNVPAQSPFNLQNTSASTSSASFDILGVEIDSTTGQKIGVTGTFTTPFTTQNFQQILATVVAGGTVTTAFSAQFATAPEPGTWIELMVGLCLVGISAANRKRLTKE
jgi:hypothetical protein